MPSGSNLITPQGDGNIEGIGKPNHCLTVQISLPRKGTETLRNGTDLTPRAPSSNLITPQGDGNGVPFSIRSTCRGSVQISLPRKGTETTGKNEEGKTKKENSLPNLIVVAECSSFFFLPFSFFL